MSDFGNNHKEHTKDNPVTYHNKTARDTLRINKKNGLVAGVVAVGTAITVQLSLGWQMETLHDTGVLVSGAGITGVAASYVKRGWGNKKDESFNGRVIGYIMAAVGGLMILGAYEASKPDDTQASVSTPTTVATEASQSSVTGSAGEVTLGSDGHCRIYAPIPSQQQVAHMSKDERNVLEKQIEEFRSDINAAGVQIASGKEYTPEIGLAITELEIRSGLTAEQADAEKWGQSDCQRFAVAFPEQFGDYWVTG